MNTVHYYKDSQGEYRWKVLSENNRIVADSGEGYQNKQDAKNEAERLFPNFKHVEDENES